MENDDLKAKEDVLRQKLLEKKAHLTEANLRKKLLEKRVSVKDKSSSDSPEMVSSLKRSIDSSLV